MTALLDPLTSACPECGKRLRWPAEGTARIELEDDTIELWHEACRDLAFPDEGSLYAKAAFGPEGDREKVKRFIKQREEAARAGRRRFLQLPRSE